jgi:predicted dehydrogenase
MSDDKKNQQLGIALVGLGKYSEGQLAPALQETKHCRLAGIVTGSPDKVEKWTKKYDIPDSNVYSYENFDSIKDNPDIDIIYVVLPNAMHAEYVIRAAGAGKHVICEKPMAVSVAECEQMIEACEKAGRLLSIGYRLHFEPNNLAMTELHTRKQYGNIKMISAENGMKLPSNEWRATKELAGGGPLMDLGIYCVQGAIYTVGEEPIAVTAEEGPKTQPETFKDVEQSLMWSMEFPNGVVANCKTSYVEEYNLLRADCERGWMQLQPSYEYSGIRMQTSEGKQDFPEINQQAAQMDDFALCVMNNTKSRVPGEMGMRDVRILMAIYEAMRTGKRVEINEKK